PRSVPPHRKAAGRERPHPRPGEPGGDGPAVGGGEGARGGQGAGERVVSEARDAALFLQLILGLSQSAMIALGKLQNPITRKIEVDLEAARATIDTLAALEDRTRGNLSSEEARVLQQALSSLRLNYVDVLKQQSSYASAEPPASDPSRETPEPPAAPASA